jgi:FkbM family methyltransferase
MDELQKLYKSNLEIKALDVGARGGFLDDLSIISPLVDAIGFEPDKEECDKLNASVNNLHWRSLRYIPTALGTGIFSSLSLYRKRGCSSLIEADQDLGKKYSRGDYYILDDKIDIPIMPMDEASQKYKFEDASYMKIDIQGAEMDVFDSGKKLMAESMLGIRTEVSFIPLYKNQPLFVEIDTYLRSLNFALMGFIEQHHWRRSTKIKYPRPSKGKYPFSKGQLVHGDALYLRVPENMPNKTEKDQRRLLTLALISAAYGFIDHAEATLSLPGVKDLLKTYGLSRFHLMNDFSKELKKKTRAMLIEDTKQNFIKLFNNFI